MSTPEEDVEIALFTKAMEYNSTLPVFLPNASEPPPVGLTGHVVVTHFRNGSVGYSLSGDGDAQFIGILQMCIYLPRGQGANEMRKRGAEIASLFWTPANLSLTRNTTRVRVSKRPVLGTAITNDTSYVMVVSVYYEVFM